MPHGRLYAGEKRSSSSSYKSLCTLTPMWYRWRLKQDKMEELAKLGNRLSLQVKAGGDLMTEMDSEILTLEEVAVYLKAGKRTVYRLTQKGEIPAFKLGGTWRFRRSELDSWIAESINKKRPEVE